MKQHNCLVVALSEILTLFWPQRSGRRALLRHGNSTVRRAGGALTLLLTLGTAGSHVAAQTDGLVDNVYFQTNLRQALEDVSAQVGVNIIADPSVQGVVSVELDGVTLDKALELLLAGTGYRVEKEDDYYLVYDPDTSPEVFADVADTRLITLENVAPRTARELLPEPLSRYVRIDEQTGRLSVTAPNGLMERIVNEIVAIDQPSGEATELIPLEHIQAESARTLLPETLQRFVRVDAERNTLAVTASATPRRRIVQLVRQFDVPLPPTSTGVPDIYRTRVVKLSHAKTENTLALLPETLSQYVRGDPETNTLAISAPAHLVEGILSDIRAIDAPRRHVMLDARVVVLDRADLLDFGVQWDFPTASAGTFTSDQTADPNWPYVVQIGFTPGRAFTNALSLNLNLLSQNDDASIISSPKVLAQDGQEAQISITTEEFFEVTGDADVFTRAELEEIETGTTLLIKPHIGSNNKITLDLNIEVSDVIARGDENLPIVSRRTANSTVQVEDGGTAAIAGLIDTRSQLGIAGVPGLSKAPLIGNAFGNDTVEQRERQVAVFVTATLVKDDDEFFKRGHKAVPPLNTVSEEKYRAQLKRALETLRASTENQADETKR